MNSDIAVPLLLSRVRRLKVPLQGPLLVALAYLLGAEGAFYIGTLSDQIYIAGSPLSARTEDRSRRREPLDSFSIVRPRTAGRSLLTSLPGRLPRFHGPPFPR